MQEKVARGTRVKKIKMRGARKKNSPTPKKMMTNSKVSDSSGKVIFDEPILCAGFSVLSGTNQELYK